MQKKGEKSHSVSGWLFCILNSRLENYLNCPAERSRDKTVRSVEQTLITAVCELAVLRSTRQFKSFFAPPLARSKFSFLHLPVPIRYSSLTVSSFQVLYRSGERIGSVTRWQPSRNERCQFLPTPGFSPSGTDDSSAMENSSRPAPFAPTTTAALRAMVSGFFVSAPHGRNVTACPARMRMCCCRPCRG